jgi:hypothetical protein
VRVPDYDIATRITPQGGIIDRPNRTRDERRLTAELETSPKQAVKWGCSGRTHCFTTAVLSSGVRGAS